MKTWGLFYVLVIVYAGVVLHQAEFPPPPAFGLCYGEPVKSFYELLPKPCDVGMIQDNHSLCQTIT
jgi:hypothetical protein